MLAIAAGLCGGTALLLFALAELRQAVDDLAGARLRGLLTALAGDVPRALLTGTIVTAVLQSSTVVSVLIVSLAGASQLGLRQALGLIYGANIGTTVTAQLMAFPAGEWALILLALGLTCRRRPWGRALASLGWLFLGLHALEGAAMALAATRAATGLLAGLSDSPVLAACAGGVAAMLFHSSSAAVGLTMALAAKGLLDLPAAVAVVLGTNVGTCFTAQLVAMGRGYGARRAAWGHTLYNLVGAVAALCCLRPFVRCLEALGGSPARQLANAHALFNLASAAAFLPFTALFARLLCLLAPGED